MHNSTCTCKDWTQCADAAQTTSVPCKHLLAVERLFLTSLPRQPTLVPLAQPNQDVLVAAVDALVETGTGITNDLQQLKMFLRDPSVNHLTVDTFQRARSLFRALERDIRSILDQAAGNVVTTVTNDTTETLPDASPPAANGTLPDQVFSVGTTGALRTQQAKYKRRKRSSACDDKPTAAGIAGTSLAGDAVDEQHVGLPGKPNQSKGSGRHNFEKADAQLVEASIYGLNQRVAVEAASALNAVGIS